MPTLPAPYQYGHDTIYLPLSAQLFAGLPAVIEHGADNLRKKTEFHVSLVSVEQVILTVGTRADIRHKDIENTTLAIFAAVAGKMPLKVARFTDDVRFAVDREKQSIFVRCSVPHLDEVFMEINKIFGVSVPLQPAHVTLYTLEPNVGIGIWTEGKMSQYERIDVPSIALALEKIALPH